MSNDPQSTLLRKIRLARLALGWERLWDLAFPAVMTLGAAALFVVSGVAGALPVSIRIIVLLCWRFCLSAAASGWRTIGCRARRRAWPVSNVTARSDTGPGLPGSTGWRWVPVTRRARRSGSPIRIGSDENWMHSRRGSPLAAANARSHGVSQRAGAWVGGGSVPQRRRLAIAGGGGDRVAPTRLFRPASTPGCRRHPIPDGRRSCSRVSRRKRAPPRGRSFWFRRVRRSPCGSMVHRMRS